MKKFYKSGKLLTDSKPFKLPKRKDSKNALEAILKPKRRNNDPEYHLHVSVVTWFRLSYPKALFTISPAGIKLPPWIGGKFKAMGYRIGTLDWDIMEPRGGYHGFRVEFKAKPNKPSAEQLVFIQEAKDRGYHTAVYYEFEDAKAGITSYMNLK